MSIYYQKIFVKQRIFMYYLQFSHPFFVIFSDKLVILVRNGSLTPENLASLMAAYFFVKFRKFLVRNSVIYDIIRLYHLS